ncbi:MAG: SH3 domain-containing protein [Acidobacteriota bacterium]
MKRIILIFSLIFALSVSVSPVSFKTEFSKANSFYERGDFKGALDSYLKIESSISNWKLFYNIGNTYFKLGDLVRSKIYFLKAKSFEPFNESIEKNLDIIERALNNHIHLPDPGFISRLLKKIESFITIDLLSVLLIFLLLLFAFFEFMIIKKGRGKKLVYSILISLIMVITISSYHMLRVNDFNKNKFAVVIVRDSKLRSGPGTGNTVLFDISPGVTVKIIDNNRDWVQITASPEIAGWIEKGNIEKIK